MSRNKVAVFEHFRPEEKPFVERSLDWIQRATDRYQIVTTPFLDPREQYILDTLVRREPDLVMFADGGYPLAERCRVLVGHSYMQNDSDMFHLTFLRVVSTSGNRLEHPDVLGALLGLGIKREKIGDINPHSSGCDCIVAEDMSDFIQLQLTKVGRERVSLTKILREEFIQPEQKLQVRVVTVASLRVDALVSEGFRLSRNKASLLIKSGRCKVNWKVVDQPDYSVEAGDIISLRRYGRIKIQSIDGLTKKRRNLVQIASFE